MADRERRLGVEDRFLRRHATGPEYRDVIGFHCYRFAVFGPGEILNAERARITAVVDPSPFGRA